MADVFISYRKRDTRPRVEALASLLDESGVSVWFDKSLGVGGDFRKEIEEELNRATAVIVCWSKTARESDWVLAEAILAHSKKNYIPVFLDSEPPPERLPLPLGAIHGISFITWDKTNDDLCFKQLLGVLARSLSRPQLRASLDAHEKEVREVDKRNRDERTLKRRAKRDRELRNPKTKQKHERSIARIKLHEEDPRRARLEELAEQQLEKRKRAISVAGWVALAAGAAVALVAIQWWMMGVWPPFSSSRYTRATIPVTFESQWISGLRAAQVSGDGARILYTAEDYNTVSDVFVVDVTGSPNPAVIPKLDGSSSWNTIAISFDGTWVGAAGLSDPSGPNNVVGIVGLNRSDALSQAFVTPAGSGPISRIVSHPTSPLFATIQTCGTRLGCVSVWDAQAHRAIATLPLPPQGNRSNSSGATDRTEALQFSPDGRLLAYLLASGHLLIWDWRNGRLVADLQSERGLHAFRMDTREDGETIAYMGDSIGRIFQSSAGSGWQAQEIYSPAQRTCSGPSCYGTRELSISPSGKLAAVQDDRITILDGSAGTLISERPFGQGQCSLGLCRIVAAGFIDDNALVVSGVGGPPIAVGWVFILDPSTLEPIYRLQGELVHVDPSRHASGTCALVFRSLFSRTSGQFVPLCPPT